MLLPGSFLIVRLTWRLAPGVSVTLTVPPALPTVLNVAAETGCDGVGGTIAVTVIDAAGNVALALIVKTRFIVPPFFQPPRSIFSVLLSPVAASTDGLLPCLTA